MSHNHSITCLISFAKTVQIRDQLFLYTDPGYLEIGGEEIEGLCLREARADFDDGELAGDDVHNARVLQLKRIEMYAKEKSSTLTH
jgi:hypothetical protein